MNNKFSAKEEILRLRNLLKEHSWKYYAENSPVISDEEYDALFDRLLELERTFPDLARTDSPTQRVGTEIQKEFSPAIHSVPMLSLDKVTSKGEFYDFVKRVKNLLFASDESESQNDILNLFGNDTPDLSLSLTAEPKLDGLAIEVIYKEGKFEKAITRGDGVTGEDVTQNAKTIRSIPLELRGSPEDIPSLIEVRGEVIILKEDFEKLNKEQSIKGLKLFSNSRNTASGSLRQLDPSVTSKRRLSAFFYDIGLIEGLKNPPKTHKDQIELLIKLGIPPVSGFKTFSDECSVADEFQRLSEIRENLPFEIDGMVVKVDRLDFQKKLGELSRTPRWAIAWKFPSMTVVTKIREIEWNVGRTGVVTPLATLDPVSIGGVIVKKATLHNEDFIKEKDLKINDSVIVKRAGDVIPHIEGVVTELRNGSETEPDIPYLCPSCGSQLYKPDNEVFRRCPNRTGCPAQISESIIHFVSRPAMNIDGLGEKQILSFIKAGLIKNFADLYRLKAGDLLILPRTGEKSVLNILEAIAKSKSPDLPSFIFALGIPGVGEALSSVLATRFGSISQLAEQDIDELIKIPDIGPTIAKNIQEFFNSKINTDVLADLFSLGVKPVMSDFQKIDANDLPLYGKTFVFTGTLSSLTRDQAKKKVTMLGAKTSESVGKKTDFLVSGEDSGSKLEKALKYGIRVLNEDEFLRFLKDYENTDQRE